MSDEGILPNTSTESRVEAKKLKAAEFSDYSRELGRLAPVSNEVSGV
jgi:hypothetical protein